VFVTVVAEDTFPCWRAARKYHTGIISHSHWYHQSYYWMHWLKIYTMQMPAYRNGIWIIKEHHTPRIQSHGGGWSGYSYHTNRSGKACQLWTFLFYVLSWNGPCVVKLLIVPRKTTKWIVYIR